MKQAKSNKDKFIAVLVDTEMHRRVAEAAAKERRSISQFVRLLIERTLDKKTA